MAYAEVHACSKRGKKFRFIKIHLLNYEQVKEAI